MSSSSPQAKKESLLELIFTKKMLICIMLGFSSGLPLYILIQLIPAWLTTFGLNIKTIGLFAYTQIPYVLKFLWSPFLDRIISKQELESFSYFRWLFALGRRRSWMFITQISLLFIIISLGTLSPQDNLYLIANLTFLLSFVSATQDITLDAYRRELLNDNEQGLGNSLHVYSYRLAGLIPGGLSLILSDYYSWDIVFLITGSFMALPLITTLIIKEPIQINTVQKRTLLEIIINPFKEFIQRKGVKSALIVLLFLFFYKLGDSMTVSLATPFYKSIGFSNEQIGLIAKNAMLWPAIIGGLVGGILMLKIGINKSLWLFGAIQMASILGFVWLSTFIPVNEGEVPSHYKYALTFVLCFESLGVGLGTAAFVAFMARMTNPLYTATQFALFSSITGIPRVFINGLTGFIVDSLGWTDFFWICFFLAIPGMLLLFIVAPWRENQES